MEAVTFSRPFVFSVVVPCYNEERTLENLVDKLLAIQDDKLSLEVIIVDDCSKDNSLALARGLAEKHAEIQVLHHEVNQGKGAALRTGFKAATGEFVGIQDADLEYNPMELRNLLKPMVDGRAEVMLGSRYLSTSPRRVLYFWHSMGNRFLTFLSNMFTDLDLTDMETCYKVFKREVIQSVDIEENRFGFEPEIIAKVAQQRVRVFEMGISYTGRTYEEGKKINYKDGLRALYCIFHYNSPKAPMPIQFLLYTFIGAIAGLVNLASFLLLLGLGSTVGWAATLAYGLAAAANYWLCIFLVFRHGSRWNTRNEILVYMAVIIVSGFLDVILTKGLISVMHAVPAKVLASGIVLVLNYFGRRQFVFPEKPLGPWKT